MKIKTTTEFKKSMSLTEPPEAYQFMKKQYGMPEKDELGKGSQYCSGYE